MKKIFSIGAKNFGEGKPKICVPIVAKSRDDIWKKAEEIAALRVDIVEWRVDFYERALETEEVLTTLAGLKERLINKALLFTLRTKREGGNLSIEKEDYYRLNRDVAASGYAKLVDIEAFFDETKTIKKTIQSIKNTKTRVIASNHDFEKTPAIEEMVRRLCCMEELGADVAKLAVMPRNEQDVLDLLQATVIADKSLSIPLVTMSMGNMGVISRICGSLTGSAMTFASVGETSAPGQIPVEQMRLILQALNQSSYEL